MLSPKDIRFTDQFLEIDWDNDQRSKFEFQKLRFECPCAYCRDEFTGRRLIQRQNIDPGIKPLKAQLTGAYGLKIHWSDRHQTGIYSWDYLLDLEKIWSN